MIDIEAWYDKFADKGVGYGPSFNGLSDLRAYQGENLATANVALRPTLNSANKGESLYPLHPATIDTCLQLALIACHAGQVERFQSAFVPILVHDMSIWVPEQQRQEVDFGYGLATGELRGLRGAYAQTRLLSVSGARILDIKDIRCVAYDGSGNATSRAGNLPRDPYMRLVWKPDIESLSSELARTMFPPANSHVKMAPLFENFDRLATYILVQISMVQQPVVHDYPKHIQKFLAWVQRCFDSAKAGKLPFSSEALSAPASSRSEVIERLSLQMSDIIEIRIVKRIYDTLPAILSNQTSGLQVALQDNLLAELYATGLGIAAAYPQLLHMLDLLAHKNPRMKILEIGGGTGGATRVTTKALQGDTFHKRYQEYTFTDVSSSFLSSAEAEFSMCKGMVYKILDIERDPIEQGYKAVYDLIIASDVLHATSSIAQTVRNARKLLKPGGRMVLIELTRELIGTGILLGTFPDYWNGEEDDRRDSPLLDREAWNAVLSNNGFSGIDIVLDDYPAPLSAASVIVTTAVDNQTFLFSGLHERDRVYMVYWGDPPLFASTLADQLQKQDLDPVGVSFLDSHIPHKSRIICLVDLEGTRLSHPGQDEIDAIKKIFYTASSLIWISAGGLIQASDPEAAIMVGLIRVISTETPSSRVISIDLEPAFDQASVNVARSIVEKEMLIQQSPHNLVEESEYVFSDGCLQVSRLVPDKQLNRRFRLQQGMETVTEVLPVHSQGPLGATFGHPGLLSSLYFKSDPKYLEPLKNDWIEIKTSAMGLNMKVSVA